MIRVSCGYSFGEKRMIRRTIYLNPDMTENAQRREAEKQTALLLAQYEMGKVTATKPITLARFTEIWWRDYVNRKGLADRTKQCYKQLLTSRILPMMGNIKVRDIKPRTLQEFYARLDDEPLSGTMKRKYHTLLHNMLKSAVRWQIIPYNPADAVEPPRNDTKQFAPYTDKQAAEMLQALTGESAQWRAYIYLALYGQLRRGEMVGLDWAAVNGDTIQIKQAAVYVPGEGVKLKPPKTASGARSITVPSTVCDALRRWKAEQNEQRLKLGEFWHNSGAVFTQWDGQRMHPDTPTRWFDKFLKRHELPHIRLHDLRHTGASLLIAGGMDIETVKNRLGHARASTTMDIYAHAYEHNDRRAADLLAEILQK